MRITAGRHKGLTLEVPPGERLRPTADRARQAIFNILIHGYDAVASARVLDAFAGSGALGIEALSRGAISLVALDKDRVAATIIARNLARAGERERGLILPHDALTPPRAADYPRFSPCSLVFLDPPYGSGLIAPALASLGRQGWLAPGALIVVEMDRRESFAVPEGFALLDERRYGRARLIFLRAATEEKAEAPAA